MRQRESLWTEHRRRLFRFVLARVADEATAEDIVHDVLVRAYVRRNALRDHSRFTQWLYQIARNAVIDHYRAQRPTIPLPENLPDAESEDSHQARMELSACLQPFVQALPDHYRKAIELSEIQGRSQRDIADELGLSLSGAKSRIQRGRRMLADMVLDCCRLEFDSTGSIMSYEPRDPATGSSGSRQ